MLAVFVAYSAWTIIAAMRAGKTIPDVEEAKILGEDPGRVLPPMGWALIGASFVGGLALLSFGGSLASDGASGMAIGLGIPAAVVGVTIVSIGTTLPELITGVLAVRNGQTDLALGNAIGSCLFNAGAIFGVTGLIAPPVADQTFVLPLIYMALLAIALIPITRTFGKTIARIEGAGLLASYAIFLVLSALR